MKLLKDEIYCFFKDFYHIISLGGEMNDLEKLFKALADKNRMRILKMLEQKSLCVCEVTHILKLAPSTVSKHLSILRAVGLIFSEQEGKWINYKLAITDKNTLSHKLFELIAANLNDEGLIKTDQEKVLSVKREILCKGYFNTLEK